MTAMPATQRRVPRRPPVFSYRSSLRLMLAFRHGHDRTVGSMLAQSHTRQDRSEDDVDRDTCSEPGGDQGHEGPGDRCGDRRIRRVAAGTDLRGRRGRMQADPASGRDRIRVGRPLRRPLQHPDTRVRRGDRAPRGGGHPQDGGRGPRRGREPARGADRGHMAGATGPTLVEESRTAELLVVGHRGRGELASVLLGSVGLYCVLQAHAPVLVVRPPTDTSDRTGRTPRPRRSAPPRTTSLGAGMKLTIRLTVGSYSSSCRGTRAG